MLRGHEGEAQGPRGVLPEGNPVVQEGAGQPGEEAGQVGDAGGGEEADPGSYRPAEGGQEGKENDFAAEGKEEE